MGIEYSIFKTKTTVTCHSALWVNLMFDARALTLQRGTASASLIWVQKRSRAHFLPMWQLF